MWEAILFTLTGQGIGPGIAMAIDTYNWINDDNEDGDDAVASSGQSRDDPEPPIDEEVFENTQQIVRREASRSRSPDEQPSGSNDAIRLLRRGANRSRSISPPKRNPKK